MKNIFECKPDLDFRGYGCYSSGDWYYELLEREKEHFLKLQERKLIERCRHGKWVLSAHAERLCEEEARTLSRFRRARTEGFRKWFVDRLQDRPINGLWVITDFFEGIEELLCERDHWANWREMREQSRSKPENLDDIPF
jgi:hypothetical protein